MNWAEILKELLKFFPRFEILDPDEGGLFIRGGKVKKVIYSGVYFCMPYFDEIERYTVAVTTLESFNQSITSKDKKHILISWSVAYMIIDPEKAILHADDIDQQLAACVASRIVDYVAKHDYESIKGHLLKNYIMHDEFMNECMDDWGIHLKGFYLHDLGLHRIFRIVSDRALKEE